jgi:hypothetical protein
MHRMLLFGTVSGLVVVAVVLVLVLGHDDNGTTVRQAARPAPPELQPGEAAVTVTAQGSRVGPDTARRQRGYATVLVRNQTDGTRWIRIGGSSPRWTTVGLRPHTAAENQSRSPAAATASACGAPARPSATSASCGSVRWNQPSTGSRGSGRAPRA